MYYSKVADGKTPGLYNILKTLIDVIQTLTDVMHYNPLLR